MPPVKFRLLFAAACIASLRAATRRSPDAPAARLGLDIVVIGRRGSDAVARARRFSRRAPSAARPAPAASVPDARGRGRTRPISPLDVRRRPRDGMGQPLERPGAAVAAPGAGARHPARRPRSDLPARLTAFAPVAGGDYALPVPLGADWRFFAPRAQGRRALRSGGSEDVEKRSRRFDSGGPPRRISFPPTAPPLSHRRRLPPHRKSLPRSSSVVDGWHAARTRGRAEAGGRRDDLQERPF